MVQPTAPYSCILAPAFAWGTAVCQPVYDLVNKISAFVSSIFTAIGDFIRSWLCCPTAAAPIANVSTASTVPAPASSIVNDPVFPEAPPALSTVPVSTPSALPAPASSIVNDPVFPEAPPALSTVPVSTPSALPAAVSVSYVTVPFPNVTLPSKCLYPIYTQAHNTLLRTLTNYFCASRQTTREFLVEAMGTDEKAVKFFVRLIGYACAMGPSIPEHSKLVEKVERLIKSDELSTYIARLSRIWEENVPQSSVAEVRERFIINNDFDRSADTGPEAFLRLGANLVDDIANLPYLGSFFKTCTNELRLEYLEDRSGHVDM